MFHYCVLKQYGPLSRMFFRIAENSMNSIELLRFVIADKISTVKILQVNSIIVGFGKEW